jgi:hypothetical protein
MSNLFRTCVYLITFCFTYLYNRPNRPWRSSNECIGVDVGSPARWLRYIELNQLGARIMKMHASPAAGRQQCWLAGWLAAINQRADVAALPYRNIHVCTCACMCVYTYIYKLILTWCHSYACVDICLRSSRFEGVVPHQAQCKLHQTSLQRD